MSIEGSAPGLSVGYFVEQVGFCEDCSLARVFAFDIVKAAEVGEPIDPVRAAARFALYISACKRDRPFPSQTSVEDPCMEVNKQRKCLHDELVGLHSEERTAKIAEIIAQEQ